MLRAGILGAAGVARYAEVLPMIDETTARVFLESAGERAGGLSSPTATNASSRLVQSRGSDADANVGIAG